MLYKVGEKVRVKSTKELATVKEVKYTEREYQSYAGEIKRTISREYYVKYGMYRHAWLDEEKIESLTKLDDEAKINSFLIDLNLKYKKI